MNKITLSTVFSFNDFENVVAFCVENACSDIHFSSGKPILARISGKLQEISKRSITDTEITGVLTKIYSPEARAYLAQMESLNFSYSHAIDRKNRYRFRVNASKYNAGIMLVLRHIPENPLKIEALNVENEIMEAINKVVGLVVFVGATGSGKSTLLSSIIRHKLEQQDESNHIITIEAPIEFLYDKIDISPYSRISQREVGRDTKSFSTGAIDSRRQDPDIILIGESRDYETISETVACAETGHLVFSTVHANDVAQTIPRMANCYPAEQQPQIMSKIVSNIELIVAQRLVPTLDGKRKAIRELLAFNDQIRGELEAANNISLKLKELVKSHGKPFENDLKSLLDNQQICFKTYKKYGGIDGIS